MKRPGGNAARNTHILGGEASFFRPHGIHEMHILLAVAAEVKRHARQDTIYSERHSRSILKLLGLNPRRL